MKKRGRNRQRARERGKERARWKERHTEKDREKERERVCKRARERVCKAAREIETQRHRAREIQSAACLALPGPSWPRSKCLISSAVLHIPPPTLHLRPTVKMPPNQHTPTLCKQHYPLLRPARWRTKE